MRKTFLVILVLAIFSTVGYSLEFQPVGARQLGMGGAGVASSYDATAQYYNPAIFGFFGKYGKETLEKKKFGINTQLGAGIRLNNNLGEALDELSKIDYDALSNIASTSTNLTQSDYTNAVKLLSILKKIQERGGALTINADGLIASRVGRFGIGLYGIAEASGKPLLDFENIGFTNSTDTATVINAIVNGTTDSNSSSSISPTANSYFGSSTVSQLQTALQNAGFSSDESIDIINAAATQLSGTSYSSNYVAEAVNLIADSVSASKSGKTIDNNQSAISVNGIALLEVPLTYGRPINDSIALGASLKLIKGRVYQRDITIFNNNSSEIVNDLRDSYKESNNFALDFGALWMPNNWIKVGATAKYLNSPSFDKPDGGEYKVKPQGRVGIALNPFETLTFALDMDVTKNDTSVNGYKSQNIGGGVEWDVLKFLALRAGAYQNLAESDIGMVYTLGLGLNMYLVRGDLSVAFSGKKNQYDGDNIPKETRIQANLSIEF